MTERFTIRLAAPSDFEIMADVMFDAVRNGPSKYSETQRRAWVPEVRNGDEWNKRLGGQTVFLAEENDLVVGFMSLAENGYIDLAFIRPAAQGTGLLRKLYDCVEELARENNESKLWTHASLMAMPAFKAMGMEVVKQETVEVLDQSLERYEMNKRL